MERRHLGADGPEITVVGIGTAPIGSMPVGSAREYNAHEGNELPTLAAD